MTVSNMTMTMTTKSQALTQRLLTVHVKMLTSQASLYEGQPRGKKMAAELVIARDALNDVRRAQAVEVEPSKITILRDLDDEYRVPSPKGTDHEASAYYTPDKEDAEGTARMMHGNDVIIKFRKVDSHANY